MPKPKNELILIVGPTAVGKSRVAYLLAKRIKGEIISADSMQVYKGLGILTNYPDVSMRKRIPHHLVSIIGLNQEFNVAKFIKHSKKALGEITKKAKVPIVVGGSGMYINVLLDGVFKGPGQDRKLRKKLEDAAHKFGNDYLYRRLEKLDPEAALGIHPNNLVRIIRALEVCIKTGKKISELKKNRKGLWQDFDVKIIGLNRARGELYKIIDSRVETMFHKGAVQEVKMALGKKMSKTSGQIIGIKEIAGFLNQEYNKEEAKRLIKRNSRHFAKRQISWFGRDSRIHWVEIKKQDKPGDILKVILKYLN